MTEYWKPNEIFFTREQVFWLINFLPTLREGQYPTSPLGTGYTDAPVYSKSRSSHADFETPCQISAELRTRLESCGIDGKLLVKSVQAGDHLSELEPEARRALNYCSGWRRRRMPYRDWVSNRKWRENMTTHRRMSLKGAPPSYADMGKTKPVKEGRNENKELTVRIITCLKCHKPEGTLIKFGKAGYFHKDCLSKEN